MNLPARNNRPDRNTPPSSLSTRHYSIDRAAPSAIGPTRTIYDDESPVFVLANLKLAAGFPFRAVQRHKRLAVILFSSLMALMAVALVLGPKHYTIETKFFAEKNFVMPALGNPRRAVPTESDSPTRLAAEAVKRRSNLIEIIRQTKLLGAWNEMRSPIGQIVDRAREVVTGPMTEEDRLDGLLTLLDKRMWVNSEDGTVTIGIDWMNPTLGLRIVQAAQQNFFEQRHASEVSLINESIGILEGHVASSQRAIQDALKQINAALPAREALSLPTAAVATGGSPAPAAPSAAAVALEAELRAKQQAIADITGSRSQRLAALQTRLAELRTTYGSAHPDVVATEENIRSLNEPSPQLAALKSEEQALRTRLASMGTTSGGTVRAAFVPSYERVALERLTRAVVDTQEAPEVTFARSRLKIATNDYEDMLDRLESAKIEMETARAAFKYRYSLITPAKMPKKADRPMLPLLILGGVVLAGLVTMFTAVVLDFTSGRVVEPWQVDRMLGVPVLAEVQRR